MAQPVFVDLQNHADYEILNEYPFTIRRKDNHKEVNEFVGNGYVRLRLNGKKYMKHRLIALQFLPNPNNCSEVTHINNDNTDNHLSNLRWTGRSQNIPNIPSFSDIMTSHSEITQDISSNDIPARYVDEIDQESLVCDYYETKTERYYFTDYYYNDDMFYYDNGMNYRILNINVTKSGSRYVNMYDTEGNRIKVVIARFLEQHDML